MVAESHQSPRASSRGRICRPRATATRGRCGPQLLSGRRRQAQPRRGRREAPRAKTPRAATSRHRHILARAACLLRVWTSSSTTARPLPPSHRVAHRRPLRAQRCRSPQRCRSRRLTEPLRQLALRYRRPPPTLGHYRGRAERRARRCGAGSGFYSASGAISPIYGHRPVGRSHRINN